MMRVRVCVLFLSHEEKKEKRESALFVCADFYFVSSSSCLLGVWRSLRQQEKRDRPVHKKRKERKESFHSCGSKKRDFSDDDDDEGVYIFLSEKKMAQRSPRKSLQLNRANTPINFSGPMQDVNVSSASFFF
tara:strand:- start:188 stop:583 length:396 start_codon:yes stop_codon:yes gene_type:complete